MGSEVLFIKRASLQTEKELWIQIPEDFAGSNCGILAIDHVHFLWCLLGSCKASVKAGRILCCP
jgi:hypothetical protein